MARVVVVIPARLDSERVHEKPLIEIDGTPLICHVVQQVLDFKLDIEVAVATDSLDVALIVTPLVKAFCVDTPCLNGTERVAVAVQDYLQLDDEDVVVNLQGDQLFFPPEIITGPVDRVLAGYDVGTAVAPVGPAGSVKAVLQYGECVGFYREAAWSPRMHLTVAHHVGVYAFHPPTLRRWAKATVTPCEEVLHLEQVRALEMGMTFGATWLNEAPQTIDVPEDVEVMRERMAWRSGGIPT